MIALESQIKILRAAVDKYEARVDAAEAVSNGWRSGGVRAVHRPPMHKPFWSDLFTSRSFPGIAMPEMADDTFIPQPRLTQKVEANPTSGEPEIVFYFDPANNSDLPDRLDAFYGTHRAQIAALRAAADEAEA